ncbi:MAG: hypothetical protein ACUZ77_09295 [Candidatus Brocadiales bacterium]
MTPETPKKKRKTYKDGIAEGKRIMIKKHKRFINAEVEELNEEQEEQSGIGGILNNDE